MFYKVSAKYDVFGAAVFLRFVKENFVFWKGLLYKHRLGQCLQRVRPLRGSSRIAFARARATKSQTALGNRWPGPRRATQS